MTPLALTAMTATSCIGRGLPQTLAALRAQQSGLAPCAFETVDLATCVGEVAGVDAEQIPAALRDFDCRNNRLAHLGLRQDGFDETVRAAAARWGRQRVGVYLGTSTSGILQTEIAYRHRDPQTGALPGDFHYKGTQNLFSVADFLRRALDLRGPAAVISCACSSSAKVFASAARMIEAGLIDAAVVGGVDSLCLTTLYGFHALQLTAVDPCRPYDVARAGISISEAAAFVLIERRAADLDADGVCLLGTGESSDAWHMSSPHPEGLGARNAINDALARASLAPRDIDYINLHGTASQKNDEVEARIVAELFPQATRASSTKGWTGHALGAAGILEAVISLLALEHGFTPGTLNTRELDSACGPQIRLENSHGEVRHVMSNSFGFGGSNCVLLFGKST